MFPNLVISMLEVVTSCPLEPENSKLVLAKVTIIKKMLVACSKMLKINLA